MELKAAPLNPAQLPGPVWVVAPHPDDEALGCGGLMAALSERGTEVRALLLTDGGFSHPGSQEYPRERLVRARLAEWRQGLAQLGVPPERTHALNFPDGGLGNVPHSDVTRAVQQAFAAAPPALVLLPWQRDPHPDHRATWSPVLAASGAPVLGYSVWLTERGAEADWPAPAEAQALYFETAPYTLQKAAAIAAHATQLGAITDDPGGFTLAPEMVARAVAGPELYFRPAAPRSS